MIRRIWDVAANRGAGVYPSASYDARLKEAHSYFDQSRYPEAWEAYRDLIRTSSPDNHAVFKLHVCAGNCAELLGHVDDAIRSYQAALDLNADCAEAHWNLAALYLRLEAGDLAAHHRERLTQIDLGPALRLREILRIPEIASDECAIDHWRTEFAAKLENLASQSGGTIERPEFEIGATPLYLAYQGRNDIELARKVCTTVRRFYPAPTSVAIKPRKARRIHIGFVSPFFWNFSIGRLYRGLIGARDRERFDVSVFAIEHQGDETAAQIERMADHFCALPGDVATIARAVSVRQLDVLYFPEIGLHPVTYYLAYWRLAPVQCMSYGHPVTSGIDTIDYFLSAASVEPEAHQAHYAEKLVRLQGFFMPAYERPSFPHIPKSAVDFGAEPGQRVYFCPQTLFKIHPDFDSILGDILRRDGHAVLTLIEFGPSHWKRTLMQRFERTISDVADRIRFLPQQSTADYVNLLKAADAVLDTLHFGGGISTMDAFAAAVPIVTLEGTFFRGRQASACYREMGMEEYIATTPAAYVNTAVNIANDPQWRQALSARIAGSSSRLFDRLDGVRALEAFLEDAVARVHQTGAYDKRT